MFPQSINLFSNCRHQYERLLCSGFIRYLSAGFHEPRVAPCPFYITRSRPHLLPSHLHRLPYHLLDIRRRCSRSRTNKATVSTNQNQRPFLATPRHQCLSCDHLFASRERRSRFQQNTSRCQPTTALRTYTTVRAARTTWHWQISRRL